MCCPNRYWCTCNLQCASQQLQVSPPETELWRSQCCHLETPGPPRPARWVRARGPSCCLVQAAPLPFLNCHCPVPAAPTPALACSFSPALICLIHLTGAMCNHMHDQRLTTFLLRCLDLHDQQLLLIGFMPQMHSYGRPRQSTKDELSL